MGDVNSIRTLGDYSKPSHEGYRNTIELPGGNNVVPLRFDAIQLVPNGCLFYGLRSLTRFSFLLLKVLSIGKDCKTLQRYPDVSTTSRRISLRSIDSFQGLTPKSPILTSSPTTVSEVNRGSTIMGENVYIRDLVDFDVTMSTSREK
ncbi:hypothetical protein Tco_0255787 [Tanacetum coccineum]